MPTQAIMLPQRIAAGGSGSIVLTSIAESNTGVNITTLGTIDFAKWGESGSSTITPDTRRSGGGSLIGAVLYGSTPGVNQFTDSPRLISWSSGSPIASGTNSPNGVYGTTNGGGSSNAGDGFTLSCPAGVGTNVFGVYVGGYAVRLTVTGRLSDASASPVSDTTTLDDGSSSGMSGFAIFTFNAASAGQTFYIDVFSNLSRGSYSNTTLSGAYYA